MLKKLKDENNFTNMSLDMNPITDLTPYLDRAWAQWVKVNNDSLPAITQQFQSAWDAFYTQLKADWQAYGSFYDWVVAMDKPYQLAKCLAVFDLDHAENESVRAKHQYIYNGPFKACLLTCYAQHKITLEVYMDTIFPTLSQSWVDRDVQHLISPTRLKKWRHRLETLLAAYKEKFPSTQLTPPTQIISWLSQSLSLLRDSGEVTAIKTHIM
jgi:hypothetical protein